MSIVVIFSMLVIPLSALSEPKSDIIPTATPNTDTLYQNNDTSYTAETFKVLKDNEVIKLSAKDYVFGVVAAEMPALYHEEALKAQAVTAASTE